MGLGNCPLEGLVGLSSPLFSRSFYDGRRVLLTGHTGFKGGWLALWLHNLGAKVYGYSLSPPTQPSFFEAANIGQVLASDNRADLSDLAGLQSAIGTADPEIIFHLAAQPLVRASYLDPIGTFNTNVIGTANLLESARASDAVQAIVVITTDKVYDGRISTYPYRETDPLGGHDPYSASKAAAEIVAASYRASFFGREGHPARIATARAGNVLGGGDWAAERLTPDCLRAFSNRDVVRLRFPHAVRPWQHVLEPLAGYLGLAERLCGSEGAKFAKAWNFGPDMTGEATVGDVAGIAARHWGDGARVDGEVLGENPHEAGLLRLDSTLSRTELSWKPRWSLEKAVAETIAWHRAWMEHQDMLNFSIGQIRAYESAGSV